MRTRVRVIKSSAVTPEGVQRRIEVMGQIRPYFTTEDMNEVVAMEQRLERLTGYRWHIDPIGDDEESADD